MGSHCQAQPGIDLLSIPLFQSPEHWGHRRGLPRPALLGFRVRHAFLVGLTPYESLCLSTWPSAGHPSLLDQSRCSHPCGLGLCLGRSSSRHLLQPQSRVAGHGRTCELMVNNPQDCWIPKKGQDRASGRANRFLLRGGWS